MSSYVFKRAQDGVEARGWLTLTLELFLAAEDDVVDIGFRVGKLHPYPARKAIKLDHADGHHAEVLDVVGYYLGNPVRPMYLTSVSERSTMSSLIHNPPGKRSILLRTGG